MSESFRPRLALLGMPRTGKSTYLGVLWAVIQSPLDESISESNFTGDRSYIQRLAEQVARGEEIARTSVDANEEMAIELTFDPGGTAELLIPDTSGESLRLLVDGRSWSPRLLSACADVTGILLFVHPERLRVPQPLAVLGELEFADGNGAGAREPVAFDTREHAGTAAELIDAYENVAELFHEQWPIRVAIVVSAWDVVDGNPTPYEWMRSRLPGVLATFEANSQLAEVEVFGVSAQGGSLENRDELLAKGEIADRVFARDRDGRPISLADPVRWAIWGSLR